MSKFSRSLLAFVASACLPLVAYEAHAQEGGYEVGVGIFKLPEVQVLFKCHRNKDSYGTALRGLAGKIASGQNQITGVVTTPNDSHYASVPAPYVVSGPSFFEEDGYKVACVTVQSIAVAFAGDPNAPPPEAGPGNPGPISTEPNTTLDGNSVDLLGDDTSAEPDDGSEPTSIGGDTSTVGDDTGAVPTAPSNASTPIAPPAVPSVPTDSTDANGGDGEAVSDADSDASEPPPEDIDPDAGLVPVVPDPATLVPPKAPSPSLMPPPVPDVTAPQAPVAPVAPAKQGLMRHAADTMHTTFFNLFDIFSSAEAPPFLPWSTPLQ